MLNVPTTLRNTDGRPAVIWESQVAHGSYRVVVNKANKFVVEVKGNPDAMGNFNWHANVSDPMKCEILSLVLFEAMQKLLPPIIDELI